MANRNRLCGVRAGFTLVELLVVIGIIGVLIALLMPALSRARNQALKVQCMSNLRQVGLGLLNYADTNNGYLFPNDMGWDLNHVSPWPFNGDYDHSTFTTWPTAVFGTWDPPILICPSDLEPAARHSYLINEYLAYYSQPSSTTSATPPSFQNIGAQKYGGALPNHRSSSEVVLMGEKTSTTFDYYMEYGDFAGGKVDQYRHSTGGSASFTAANAASNATTPQMGFVGSNYLMLDMHVEFFMVNDSNKDSALDPWDLVNAAPWKPN